MQDKSFALINMMHSDYVYQHSANGYCIHIYLLDWNLWPTVDEYLIRKSAQINSCTEVSSTEFIGIWLYEDIPQCTVEEISLIKNSWTYSWVKCMSLLINRVSFLKTVLQILGFSLKESSECILLIRFMSTFLAGEQRGYSVLSVRFWYIDYC